MGKTPSFPKFEIANYDVRRIHVHEQKCVHFRLNRLLIFRKIGIAKNVCTFVIRCVLPTLFTHKYRGQIMGGLVQRTKLLDHFLNGILAPKRFQLTECKQRNPVEILPTYAIAHSPIVLYIRYIN